MENNGRASRCQPSARSCHNDGSGTGLPAPGTQVRAPSCQEGPKAAPPPPPPAPRPAPGLCAPPAASLGPEPPASASLPQAPAPPAPEPPASAPLHDSAASPGSAKGAGAPQRPAFPPASWPAELSPLPPQAGDPTADPIPARRTWMRGARRPRKLRGDAAGTRGRRASGSPHCSGAALHPPPRRADQPPHPPAPGLALSPPARPLPAPTSGLPTPLPPRLPAPQRPSICALTDRSPRSSPCAPPPPPPWPPQGPHAPEASLGRPH